MKPFKMFIQKIHKFICFSRLLQVIKRRHYVLNIYAIFGWMFYFVHIVLRRSVLQVRNGDVHSNQKIPEQIMKFVLLHPFDSAQIIHHHQLIQLNQHARADIFVIVSRIHNMFACIFIHPLENTDISQKSLHIYR